MRINDKKGQLTMFIIFSVLIIVGIISFFIFKGYFSSNLDQELSKPVYSAYISCLTGLAEEGISILGSQAGYISVPEFESGSPFMPFSSQLDFLGTPVPYWFYVSGNNIIKEQIPSKRNMELELQQYIQDNLQGCDFTEFERRGYIIDIDKGTANVKIEDSQVVISVKNNLRLNIEENFYSFSEHKLNLRSKLGKFYNLAKTIYTKERETFFLENYALDTLSLNAPTTGFEEGCAPIIFNFADIRQNISNSLRDNIASIKLKGSYYSNSDPYFIVDLGTKVNDNINFIYSNQWPTKIEIYGKDVAEPVGLQPGTELLGFCFVEYHLVYDVVFPVLIQIADETESFQFPVVVFLERNQIKKETVPGNYIGQEEVICKNKNQELKITTKNSDDQHVPASLSFSCLGERCYLGETTSGLTSSDIMVPRCVNGFIEARAEGYSNGKHLISSNEDTSAQILLKKIYSLELDLGNIPGDALVSFKSPEFSRSVFYPSQKEIQLVDGEYEVSVQVYRNSSLIFPARTEKKCLESTSSGISGLFGDTKTQCYEINIPSQEIDRALAGGGNSFEVISESNLKNSKKLNIDVPLFKIPSKIEEINENYINLEDSFVLVNFI
jgi:hypothetical protein